MLASFFARKEKTETVLVLDCGETSLGAALVELQCEKKPLLAWAGHFPVSAGSFPSLHRPFEVLLGELRASGKPLPSRVECFIPAAFSTNDIRTIRQTFEKPRTIEESFLLELVKKEAEGWEREGAVLEQKIVQVKLNGYPVPHPYGKAAHELEAELFMSLAPKEKIDRLCGELRRAFPRAQTEIHTSPFLVFTFLRDILEKDTEFFSLAVGEEKTEYSISKSGVLSSIGSIPFGYRTLIRLLAGALNSVPSEVESRLSLFLEKKLRHDASEELEAALLSVQHHWVQMLKGVFEDITLPQSIFILGEGKAQAVLSTFLKSKEYKSVMGLGESPKVEIVTSSLLAHFCSRAPEAIRDGDSFLMIQAIVSSRKNA